MQIGETIEGQIETIAFGGNGLLRHKGFVIFIPFTAPGDHVKSQIVELKKSFAIGRLLDVFKPGPNRTNPHCPYFGTCGGCQIQHLNDESQNNYKKRSVIDALTRLGHLKIPNIEFEPAQMKWAYRRHVTLHLRPHNGTFHAGYIAVDNTSLVVIKTCPIFNLPEDLVVEQIQEIVQKIPNSKNQEGRVTILKNEKDQYILSFSFDPSFKVDEVLFKSFLQHYPIFSGILLNFGKKTIPYGNTFAELELDHLKFKITPETFIQNHPEQSGKIYKRICNSLNTNKQKILDLYCGFGMSSLLLAKEGHTVLGIEYNPRAIQFAKENSKINKLHVQFVEGDVERLLPKTLKEFQPDTIILNPPRTGLSKHIIHTILKMNCNQIIYVSCMPATLARDLADLSKNYELKECCVYDMFPQTAHVETLVVLAKK